MKRIVVFCDGTWNSRDQPNPTNVARMAQAVRSRADDGTVQVSLYDAGVGTGLGFIARVTGGAFGRGLSENVQEAYRFIADNYEPGDEIYLFGFSRGAYTARSTAGMIRNCWLLKKEHAHRFPEAYAIYREREGGPDAPGATKFREAYAHEARIAFLGVWDTVGALGIPGQVLGRLARSRHGFHDVMLSRSVDVACHAVAIDESRKPFAPTLWDTTPSAMQRVHQEWFAGVHSDVGGGYGSSGLADVALVWMRDHAEQRGLAFDHGYFDRYIRPDIGGRLHDSSSWPMRLLGKQPRAIAASAGPELLHASVRERWAREDLGYRPANVAAYLEREEREGRGG